MSTKSKSALSETPNKASPATPRVSKPGRGVAKSESDSPSPLQNSRLSVDRSPRTVTSKPAIERRSPKIATPPEKHPTRIAKGSELQAQLNAVQEDLKKAKEQIALVEKEKVKAIDELKEAQRVSEEASEKLKEALVAQKRAEENSEIEKFRAVELEQAGIEASQKKEEEWQKEVEAVRNQHALDVAALLSTTQELQRVKQELAMTCDAKNQAMSHADDATKIAEIHVEKVEILSAELTRLKALLDSKLETETSEHNKMVMRLKSEIESLKQELEKVRSLEENLIEKEASIEQLNVELEAAKMAESCARSLVEECKTRVEELEMQVEKANQLERSASESLNSVMKQLEGNNDLLHDAESEIAALKEKVGLLEITIGRQKGDLEESERHLDMAKEESFEMAKKVESLKSELETVKEEKSQALNNEKLAASSVQTLLEEKNELINELENSRGEEDKSKKAMESLASALHEVSAEAREAKEKLLSIQIEHENDETQIQDLKLVLKATNEKYESKLNDSKHEIDVLINTIQQSKNEIENSKAEWEQKELHLVNCVKESEEENSSLEKEIKRLMNLLKQTEEEAYASKEEEAQLKESLQEVEAEVIHLQETLGKTKAESMKLKESLLDKENELQSIIQENEELRTREAASLRKVEELSKLLEEATAKKQTEENGDLTDSEKDYDMLPKVVEFSEENGHGREEKPKLELPLNQCEEPRKENSQEEHNFSFDEAEKMGSAKIENVNGKLKEDESKEKEDDSVEVEFKMWESCKIEKKEFSPERETEQESFEEEVDSKVEGGESFDQINGVSSTENINDSESPPSKQPQQKKKKKPLLGKFGSLLKKKSTSNHK
ncbi:WEB family protein At5g16730, chloroplastic [Quercus suber]|uniref:Web family protein n=1 Tax=Quercus suber TaxID=58331 RepID=A0AAW0LVP5_QUESU|nr:WEB family protein At5g16730, chloroplastic-like [Quercus suber]POE70418.1 web family protein, chloroplastic [Quercus suber]